MTKKLSILLNGILIASGMVFSDELRLAGMPASYIAILLVGLGYFFFLIRDEGKKILDLFRGKYVPVVLLMTLGVWSFLMMIYSAIADTSGEVDLIGQYLAIFFLTVMGLYLAIKGIKFSKVYLVVALVSGMVVSILSFWFDYFSVEDSSAIFLLTNFVASVLYLDEKRKVFKYIFLVCTFLIDILLNLKGEYVQIVLLIAFYLAVPIILVTSKKNVKCAGTLLLVLLIITSNMCLVPYVFDKSEVEVALTFEGSIYLDAVIAVGAFLFYSYWDKLPENVDEEKLILRRFKRGIFTSLCVYVFAIGSAVLGKEMILSLDDEGILGGIKSLFSPLLNSLSTENVISSSIENMNIFALVLMLIIFTRFLLKGYENSKESKDSGQCLLVASFSFFAMMIMKMDFGRIEIVFFYTMVTAFVDAEKRKIKRIPVSIENIRELISEHLENRDE